jgi:histidinol phosphatase-like enzyme (inositol monophosphatase family)
VTALARYSAPLSAPEAREFVPFMHELIGAAIAVIRPLFLSGVAVDTKHDTSPVTAADRGAEQAMRELIEHRYPRHGVLGEELGERPAAAGTTRYRWVLDPVDGTRAFITHCFLFGTLVALERDDGDGYRPVLGAIAHPAAGFALIGHAQESRLFASDGSQRVVRVRECARIEEATVLATSHWTTHEQRGAPNLARVQQLIERARLYRTWGDCFGYFALATAGADVMLDPKLAHWDVAAIVPVVEGAGGVVSSWTGGSPLAEPSLIATAPGLHAAVLQALHGA